MSQNATIFPTLRYHDAAAAIEFLCKAFGFERHAVYEGEGDTIAHAELKFGNGIRGSDNGDCGPGTAAPAAVDRLNAGFLHRLLHFFHAHVADVCRH